MGIKKAFLLVAVFLMASSLSIINLASAQSIPAPAVPDFSLEYSDTFTYYPPITTYSTNPYNGNTSSTTISERYIESRAVNITIKNQPYSATVNGYTTNLYYNFRVKPHFDSFWSTERFTYFPMNDTSGNVTVGDFYLWSPSNFENTTIQYSVSNLQAGDTIDIQVKAILGYNYTAIRSIGNNALSVFNTTLFAYQTSDWSPTQTITIPTSSISPTPNPTSNPTQPSSPTPTVTELSWLAVVPLLFSLFAVAVLFKHRKTHS